MHFLQVRASFDAATIESIRRYGIDADFWDAICMWLPQIDDEVGTLVRLALDAEAPDWYLFATIRTFPEFKLLPSSLDQYNLEWHRSVDRYFLMYEHDVGPRPDGLILQAEHKRVDKAIRNRLGLPLEDFATNDASS